MTAFCGFKKNGGSPIAALIAGELLTSRDISLRSDRTRLPMQAIRPAQAPADYSPPTTRPRICTATIAA